MCKTKQFCKKVQDAGRQLLAGCLAGAGEPYIRFSKGCQALNVCVWGPHFNHPHSFFFSEAISKCFCFQSVSVCLCLWAWVHRCKIIVFLIWQTRIFWWQWWLWWMKWRRWWKWWWMWWWRQWSAFPPPLQSLQGRHSCPPRHHKCNHHHHDHCCRYHHHHNGDDDDHHHYHCCHHACRRRQKGALSGWQWLGWTKSLTNKGCKTESDADQDKNDDKNDEKILRILLKNMIRWEWSYWPTPTSVARSSLMLIKTRMMKNIENDDDLMRMALAILTELQPIKEFKTRPDANSRWAVSGTIVSGIDLRVRWGIEHLTK